MDNLGPPGTHRALVMGKLIQIQIVTQRYLAVDAVARHMPMGDRLWVRTQDKRDRLHAELAQMVGLANLEDRAHRREYGYLS